MDLLTQIPHLFSSPIWDAAFFVASFVIGRLTGGIGIFFSLSILLMRITRFYFSSHPEAGIKLAQAYDDFIKLHDKHVLKSKFQGYRGINSEFEGETA